VSRPRRKGFLTSDLGHRKSNPDNAGRYYNTCRDCQAWCYFLDDKLSDRSNFAKAKARPFYKGFCHQDLLEALRNEPEGHKAGLLQDLGSGSQAKDYEKLNKEDLELVAVYYGISLVNAYYRVKTKADLCADVLAEDKKCAGMGHAPAHVVVNRVAEWLSKPLLDFTKGRKRKARDE